MKRYIFALGAAGLVGSAVLGSAAALGVDGGVVQTGTDNTLACDSDGVTVVQRSELDAVVPYSIGPSVRGIDASCAGENLVVTALRADGTQVAQSTLLAIVPSDVGTVNGAWAGGNLPLSAIDSLTVTIIS